MSEARNWKWLVPAMTVPLLLTMQLMAYELTDARMWRWCGLATVPMMAILSVQAVAGFRAYYRQLDADQLRTRREALANTAEARLFEMARGMHPEAVRLLLTHRKVVWRIKGTPLAELVDWVLDADPRVHVGFVEHVLRSSNTFSLMAKRTLNDKSYAFDPEKLVTDYEQYDGFERILQQRGMLTDGYGNQPGQWIEPWTPELAARQFGIVDLFEDVESENVNVENNG